MPVFYLKILITSKFKRLGLTGNLGKPIWVVHSDGDPDHWVKYPSVKFGLIAMFLLDDCDWLSAGSENCPSPILPKLGRKDNVNFESDP